MTLLDSLKELTVIVADTGDIAAIARAKPQDATTNPSLLMKSAQLAQYRHLLDEAYAYGQRQAGQREQTIAFMDRLNVVFGCEILKIVPGRVSTELDAVFSFDIEGSVSKARRLIALYEEAGVERERVLIKLAATWEGIKAAELLEQSGIHTNLTLIFSFAQAVACAEAGVTLVSPFVGRITDWHKRTLGVSEIPRDADPGVASVTRIYEYYKRHGYRTSVMGASFRTLEQVLDLAGCDLLTLNPELIAELAATNGSVKRRLSPANGTPSAAPPRLSEARFRFDHNEDAMAVELLSSGIRAFNRDARKLEQYAAALVR